MPAIIVLLLAASISSWTQLSSTAHAGFFDNDLETFEEIIELVSEKYVFSPDHKKLFSAAIEKMVKATNSANVTTNPYGSTITFNNKSKNYFLNYDMHHDLNILQDVYYFLHKHARRKAPLPRYRSHLQTKVM